MKGDIELLSGWEVRCPMCTEWAHLTCRIRVRNGKPYVAAVCGNRKCRETVTRPWRRSWISAVETFKAMRVA